MNLFFDAAAQPKVAKISPYLFIFDLDGVLLDSEYAFAGLVTNLAQGQGLNVNQDVVFRKLSDKPIAEKFAMIAQVNDAHLTPDQVESLSAAYRKGQEAILDNAGLALSYGALDLLKSLAKEGHILAAVTGHHASLAERALKHTRLLDFFEERVYSTESVPLQGALDPAFLSVIHNDAKFSAGGTILVDDGLAGLAAAKQAGIASFGYADPRFASHIDRRRQEMAQAGATLTVERLIDIHTLLLARSLPSRMQKNRMSFDPGH